MDKDVARLINQLYPAFNCRDIDQIMPHFAESADWPNGMKGGREVGHGAIRDYWTKQWRMINSKVTPVSYRIADKRIILEVHQLVKNMEGGTLSDGVVYHTYEFLDGMISRMEISECVPTFGASITATPVCWNGSGRPQRAIDS